MNSFSLKTVLLTLSVCLIVGCQNDEATVSDDPVSDPPANTSDDHGHDHAHPSHGPHDGDLVELGNEEYHGEIVHDEEAKTVTVYILDGGATEQVAIDADELTINVTDEGEPQQFTLAALPEDDDADGKSSRFLSSEQALVEHLDKEGVKAQLVVKIDGKAFRGDIEHSHDHEGHDH